MLSVTSSQSSVGGSGPALPYCHPWKLCLLPTLQELSLIFIQQRNNVPVGDSWECESGLTRALVISPA